MKPEKLNINLEKIKGFKKTEKDGEKFIFAKISDTRLFEGEKGTYLDLCKWNKETEYSNAFITEDVSKDEKSEIIGNVKKFQTQESSENGEDESEKPDDLPF